MKISIGSGSVDLHDELASVEVPGRVMVRIESGITGQTGSGLSMTGMHWTSQSLIQDGLPRRYGEPANKLRRTMWTLLVLKPLFTSSRSCRTLSHWTMRRDLTSNLLPTSVLPLDGSLGATVNMHSALQKLRLLFQPVSSTLDRGTIGRSLYRPCSWNERGVCCLEPLLGRINNTAAYQGHPLSGIPSPNWHLSSEMPLSSKGL